MGNDQAREDAERIVGRLSYQDKERILQNLIWDLFGDNDDNSNPILVPGRRPSRDELDGLVVSLRAEFFPDASEPTPA